MPSSFSAIKIQRVSGWLALVHAIILFVAPLAVNAIGGTLWLERLWVGLATLWIFWPLVFVLYPAGSIRHVALPMLLAVPFVVGSLRQYRNSAAMAFGMQGITFSVQGAWEYVAGYRAGRADAEEDLRAGRLAVEIYGFPQPGEREYRDILRQRYGIDVRGVGSDINVGEKVVGHAKGYNEVSEPEIKRRFGEDVFQKVETEAANHYDNQSK